MNGDRLSLRLAWTQVQLFHFQQNLTTHFKIFEALMTVLGYTQYFYDYTNAAKKVNAEVYGFNFRYNPSNFLVDPPRHESHKL